MAKLIGAVAASLAIMAVTYFAIDYGVLQSETGFLAVVAALAGIAGYSVHQVSK